ncbi:hypothetical protein KC19_VG199400 [Ceratodon purpureus]|uniref:Uncharacterized protein n=1 Tax=Ceratodon purpureus TaxID=3225 RepID=A0A8T0HRW9_CERPU|nr:hypothetical protein KC19_VG199400 [Ceratodon purpureus]
MPLQMTLVSVRSDKHLWGSSKLTVFGCKLAFSPYLVSFPDSTNASIVPASFVVACAVFVGASSAVPMCGVDLGGEFCGRHRRCRQRRTLLLVSVEILGLQWSLHVFLNASLGLRRVASAELDNTQARGEGSRQSFTLNMFWVIDVIKNAAEAENFSQVGALALI